MCPKKPAHPIDLLLRNHVYAQNPVVQVPVSFKPATSLPKACRLVLMSRRDNPAASAATLVFSLKGQADTQSPLKQVNVTAPLYQLATQECSITNPFAFGALAHGRSWVPATRCGLYGGCLGMALAHTHFLCPSEGCLTTKQTHDVSLSCFALCESSLQMCMQTVTSPSALCPSRTPSPAAAARTRSSSNRAGRRTQRRQWAVAVQQQPRGHQLGLVHSR